MKKQKLIGGIYKIEDIKTGNVYIGSANRKNGIKKRWSWHLARFRKNKHYYKELQNAWNDNENRIKFEILEICDDDELEERENYYIDYCKKVGWNVMNKQENAIRKRNVRDTSLMRLAQRGANNGNSRISEEDAIEIIIHKQQGVMAHKDMAELYNISASQVAKIGKEKWGYLA